MRTLRVNSIRHHRIRVRPIRTVRTALVCLPAGIAAAHMPGRAGAAPAGAGLVAVASPLPGGGGR
jgi:hypothetical protein